MMELSERLEKYRLVLKQMDICTKELTAAGFIRDREHAGMEKFVLSELRRVERALGAMGKPPVPQMPGRERMVSRDENGGLNGNSKIEPPGGATAKAMARTNGA